MLSPSQTTRNIRNADVGQRGKQRPGRHAVGIGIAGETEQTALLKNKTHRRRHGA